jgi:endonuclease/exonuclease/phosphatase (EEP) superfamily protein YafD
VKKFKILLINLGYCTGLDGSIYDYLTKFYRFGFLPKKTEGRVIRKLKKLVEDVDLVCMLEVKKEQFEKIQGDQYGDVENKYGVGSLLRYLPFTRKNCNGFFAKRKIPYKKHYLKNGTKKLLYEIELPGGTRLVFAHFSLNSKVRRKQFKEINKMFEGSRIVCGDFNIFKGVEEVKPLVDNDLRIVSEEPTFPACSPRKPLDLFLCSKDLKCEVEVLDEVLSDHSAVLLTTKLS